MSKKINFIVFAVLSAFVFTLPSYAMESFQEVFKVVTLQDQRAQLEKEHGLKINPYFKSGFTYSSNVFKGSDIPGSGEHSAATWTFTPGVDFSHVGDYGRIGGSYEATFKYLNRFEEANTQDQDFLIYANLKPTENTYVNVLERLTQKGSMPGSPGFENINTLDNTVKITAGYITESDQVFEVAYQNYDHDFQENVASRYSYNENRYAAKFYQPLNEKQRIYTGFILGEVEFDVLSSRDTTYWEIPFGIQGDLGRGWKGNASIGIHHRNLHADSRNDLTHVVANISMNKSFFFMKDEYGKVDRNLPTSVQLGFLRRSQESTFSTATTYDEKLWYASAKHLFTKKLRGRLSTYIGNRDFEERVFTGSRVIVGGGVFVTSPAQVKRNDNVFGLTLGFDYSVCEHLILHLDYEYSRRESNVSGLDYTDNSVSFRTTIPL